MPVPLPPRGSTMAVLNISFFAPSLPDDYRLFSPTETALEAAYTSPPSSEGSAAPSSLCQSLLVLICLQAALRCATILVQNRVFGQASLDAVFFYLFFFRRDSGPYLGFQRVFRPASSPPRFFFHPRGAAGKKRFGTSPLRVWALLPLLPQSFFLLQRPRWPGLSPLI